MSLWHALIKLAKITHFYCQKELWKSKILGKVFMIPNSCKKNTLGNTRGN